MSGETNRIFYIDATRAIAIILVLLCHVSNEFPLVNTNIIATIPFWTHDIGVLGVPLFFMISGALLLNKEYPSLSFFIKKRFLRILYPFFFWMAIFTILFFTVINTDVTYLTNLYRGIGFTWFIFALVGIYLFIPIINPFLKKFGIRGVEYFLVLWFVSIVFTTFNLSTDRLSLNLFARYVGYLFLGYYISNKKFKLSDKSMAVLGGIVLVVFLAINFYITKKYNVSMTYLTLPVIIESIGAYMLLRYSPFIKKIDYKSMLGKITFIISKYSYGMYFSHVIVIGVLFKLFNLASYSPFYIPLILVVVTVISFGINYILSKIPYLEKFSGC